MQRSNGHPNLINVLDSRVTLSLSNDPETSPITLVFSSLPGTLIGEPRVEQGVKITRFRKEVIRDGNYFKASEGLSFKVTPELRLHWASTFAQMQANGVRVGVPSDHSDSADKNRGWVVGLENVGPSLYAVIDMVGEEGPALALRNDVSLYSPAEWSDGKGHTYKRPLLHVALTPMPVIPGLQGWQAIAASHAFKERKINMDWAKIKKALGIAEEVTDANAEALILSAAETITKKATDAEAALTVEKDKATKATADLETLRLSHTPKEVDTLLLSLAVENRTTKLNALVAAAKITPAVKDKLAALYAAPDVLKLSLSKGGDNFDAVAAAIAENDPVKLKEQTGTQLLALSQFGGDKKNALTLDAEARAERASKAAGGPQR